MFGIGNKSKKERAYPFDGFKHPAQNGLGEAMARVDASGDEDPITKPVELPKPAPLPATQMHSHISKQRVEIANERSKIDGEIARLTAIRDSLNLTLEAHDAAIAKLDEGLNLPHEISLEEALNDAIKLDPIAPKGPAKRSAKVS